MSLQARIDSAWDRLRVATTADNEQLLRVLSDVPMEGNLALAMMREPDFFALGRIQRGTAQTVLFDDGKVEAMGSLLVRSGFIDGAVHNVGYLSDLRIRGVGPARRTFPYVFGRVVEDVMERTGCVAFLTTILESNTMALRALTAGPSPSRRGRSEQPFYAPLARFEMASVHFLRRRRPQPVAGLRVRAAQDSDVAALAAFLAEDHRQRPFGWRFDDGELAHRLAHWPGFALGDTLIVQDDQGQIRGCCTVWDPRVVKRYRVLRYRSEMVWVRRGFSMLSTLFRCPALPGVGEDFRVLYLCNLSVQGDDPRIFRALLDEVYARYFDSGAHFFSFPLYQDDALAPATKGFLVRRLPFRLFAVTSGRNRRAQWPTGRPGFEMALA